MSGDRRTKSPIPFNSKIPQLQGIRFNPTIPVPDPHRVRMFSASNQIITDLSITCYEDRDDYRFPMGCCENGKADKCLYIL
jgi:hypothetical protein